MNKYLKIYNHLNLNVNNLISKDKIMNRKSNNY